MRLRIILKFCSSTFVCLLLLSGISEGQSYRFRNYGTESRLPSQVIYTLNQDNNGFLWVGTTEGLSRFDGFDFYSVAFPDSAAGRFPTASLKDKNGTLWFGFNDGTLFYASGSSLGRVNLPGSSGTGISSVVQGPDGFIYVATQRKPLFRVNPLKPAEVTPILLGPDPNIFSFCFTAAGNLLIGTQENILVCRLVRDSLIAVKAIEGFDYSRIMSIYHLSDSSRFIIGTDGNGVFQLHEAGNDFYLSRLKGNPVLESASVRSVTEDGESNIWVSTSGSGVLKMKLTDGSDSLKSFQLINKTSGLPGDNVSVVFNDSKDNIWIGFNGAGLSMLSTDSFEFLAPGENKYPNNIIYIGKLRDNYLLGTPYGYYIFDFRTMKVKSFVPAAKEMGRNEISSYFVDNEYNIWIGTNGSGLFTANDAGKITLYHRSGDTGSDYINDIKANAENIWLATLNGVNIISRKTRALKGSYDMDNGLPHNSINQILLNPDGTAYIAVEGDRLYKIDPDSGVTVSGGVMYGRLLNKIMSLSKDYNGNIWVATYGNGVFKCMADSVASMTTASGLLSNYAYSILADRDSLIWIGHERGFSRYDQATGLTKVYSSDFAKGGSCNPEGLYESPDGKIFIGTTEGVIVYDRLKDRKSRLAPVNNINSIIINNVSYPYRKSFSLPYKKSYSVRISYTGIDFGNPEKVYYSTFLENYDNDWTKASSSREVAYNLRDGKYKFNLISVNEDGQTQDNPLTFELSIKKPVWRTWWFMLSVLAIVSAAVFIIVRQREKAQKKIQEYLEKELEARTRVVMKQKNEIELQNLEITDSINYAKRIQSSILPDINNLKEHFRDAFIMLYPRDIVSGDFYWFEQLEEDRFILVCADSTGHGVPGAFMSMIGSTLLQDIVSRQRISKPSQILTMLDKQIFSTLNQNLEVGISNDGMDVVVCEFTDKNRHIRFASAMRPIILIMGGEIFYIKGNRASVGGQSVIEKYFDDQEYYLSEGDAIYMFSDGLPDQFGGPDGKKMKIARLKKYISEIAGYPIPQQEQMLEKFYREWKGNYEQVDDILFMGVKI
jgi:ligand-binding sensor domain-containing protein/serine phosphatase RsbU (regulator of sigma subunit)